jgi:membrane-associated protease RseP (regulator of RpoE activity)
MSKFEQIRLMVESEFDVEEGFIDRGVLTFYVRLRENSKKAFLRLNRQMEAQGLLPVLRRKNGKIVLRVLSKPPVKPSRNIINIGLFVATLGTVFFSGYLMSPDITGALMFTGAIMAILGSHEMGHKLIADKYAIKATYPYFIPGFPPIGTFGAVIQQKSLPPNKDALFDIGFAGPITGFLISLMIAVVGVHLSVLIPISEVPPTATFIPIPLLFQFLIMLFPPSGAGEVIQLHPVAFAGWVGMVVTMLNLVPVGMFDGGHVARSLFGERAHRVLSFLGIILLILIWYPMAFVALFLSFYRHPGPLDDVSPPTTLRKLAAVGLIVIFVLCVVPIYPLL